uniref:Uncharacterized protein n=1 Tax=Acrobeloides nanus TaxID=290746 RepID=A0A914CHA9_9BILA
MLTITQPNQVIHESIIMNYLSFIAKTCYSTKVTVANPHYAAQFTMENQENGYTNVRNVYEFTYLNRDDFDLMLIPLKDHLVQNWAIGIFDMRMKKLDFFEAKNRIFDWHRDVMKKAIANIKPGVGYHSDFDIVNKGPWTEQDNETGVYVCYIAEEYIRRQGVIESQYFNYHEERRRIYTILDQQMKAMGLRSHFYSEQDFKFPIRLTKLLTQNRETGTIPELVTLDDEEELPATPQAFSTTPQPSLSSINIEQNIPIPSVSQNISLVNTIDSITSSPAMENNEEFQTPQNPVRGTSSRRSSRISRNRERNTSGSADCESGSLTKKVRRRPTPVSERGSGRPGSRSQEFQLSSTPETSQEQIVQNA